ncbi:MAG TPA: hypothetical protein DCR92_05575 [Faecalibacterium sp.]|uniref:Uncharacterized protein n=1 Tax=Faecalibacterium langellae TaxID=3435293 RepID=A0ACC9CWZ2_9FIRM|nr:hypothetical protein CGS49_09840 [Faecalibacterium prausnitzii]HAQ96710.1 hypothetical protein [Faecalibacterium sp.]
MWSCGGRLFCLLQEASPPDTFSFACQKRTRKAPATFEAREARIKGCTPLIIPKQLGSIQKIQVAALKDFLCCADLKSLRDDRRPTATYAVCRYDPSCEKVNQKNPQIFLIYKLKIKFPLNMARAERRPF